MKINSSLFSYNLLVMYVKFEEEKNTIIVYVYDKKYINNNYKNLIKLIFKTLENYYNYDIKNSYIIKMYINKYYGIIFEITKQEYAVDNVVDINLNILKDVLFLYEVDDPLKFLDNEIYYYNNKYYINLKKENINILENSNIVYGKDVYKIIGKGIKL